ncbi:hypothetical protein [Kitasatospora sp. NPDC048538]|uniref:hypothetical protein n=1 Tax=unclassified Kitasatospora TaxID=2633591 RepID=UPI0033C9F335
MAETIDELEARLADLRVLLREATRARDTAAATRIRREMRAEGLHVGDVDIARLSPLKFAHINFHGSLAGLQVLLIMLSPVPVGGQREVEMLSCRAG